MSHDVFISYSSADRSTAEAACQALEAAGISCWIAPRDAAPGAKYQGSIVRAIRDCRVMVLIFSARSNESEHVFREVHAASSEQRTIVPFRVERVTPNDDYSYYISALHWLDAFPPPIDAHIPRLVEAVVPLVRGADAVVPAAPVIEQPVRRRLRPSPAAWGLIAATIAVAGFGVFNVSRVAESAAPPPVTSGSRPGAGADSAAAQDAPVAPAAELSNAEPEAPRERKPAASSSAPATAPAREAAVPVVRPAPEQPISARRVLVLVRANDSGIASIAESVVLQELAGADYEVVDMNRAAALHQDPAVASGQTGGIASLGRRVGAGAVLLVDASADARSSVPGMFTGSAAVTLKAYATSDARLLRTERAEIGTSRAPGEIGATPAAAAGAAARAATYQATRAALTHLAALRAGR